MQSYIEYSPEVKQALEFNKPLLVLESTLITHGLPFPHNLKLAQAVEEITRDYHVTPATIAILKGKIKIGMTSDELEQLVQDSS